MVHKATAIPNPQSLRRRTHSLGGTHSTHALQLNTTNSISSSDSKGLSAVLVSEPEGHIDDEVPSSPSDYGTGTDMSDGDHNPETPEIRHAPKAKESPKRPYIDTSESNPIKEHSQPSPISPHSRAWYEFDLAVVVALVSPIGNWLTGGDHIKNLLIIVFLIFYLHQIIEVPWRLYQKSRPRRRSLTISEATVEDHHKHKATSELRRLEFFFLTLTAASPFLGALLLQYASASILGNESVSWFSIALFVLATGMRPWSHVVDRFTQRTTDLHDVIHYPSPNVPVDDMLTQMEALTKRVEQLEKSLKKAKLKLMDATEEVYEYMDETVDAVEKSIKRYERKYDKQETRVNGLEQAIETLKGKGKQKALNLSTDTSPENTKAPVSSLLSNILPVWLTSHQKYGHYIPPTFSLTSSSSSLRSFPSTSSTQLKTIPEEDTPKYLIMTQPVSIVSLILSRVGYLATLPLRAVVQMIFRTY